MGLELFLNSTTMGKIMRKGRVCILLAGRRAGKKAIIVKQNDEGKKDKNMKFAHALVMGLERCPRKVTKSMSAKKVERKSHMKPFVKYVNYNHMLPTRFMVKEDFEERYMQNKAGEQQATADFLFKKLRF